MRPVLLARIFFILLITYLGYWLRPDQDQWGIFESPSNAISVIAAFCVAFAVVIIEYATNIISSKNILLAAGGLLFGLIMGYFFHPIIPEQLIPKSLAHGACAAVFGYFGVILAIKHADRFQLSPLKYLMANTAGPPFILDTSAIIDGRICELLGQSVMAGPVIVPRFVLTELQKIADSDDAPRRAKGRRGLEILDAIRAKDVDFRVWSHDFPEIAGVDQKLVKLTKEIQGYLVTCDYNLEKVAAFQQARVVNLHDLANALRPSIFIGQSLSLAILREGKESHQGVGYLDDGTMVVVDDGRPYVGDDLRVTVTSILQTTAGRMIFAKPSPLPARADGEDEKSAAAESGGPREPQRAG